MAIYTLDPLHDPRWIEFIGRHPRASVVHTPGWLRALNKTYGYEPIVYTTSDPRVSLNNGAVFCRIASWLTGRRLVSLPFTDHCELLTDGPHSTDEIVRELQQTAETARLKYVELRPGDSEHVRSEAWQVSSSFRFHSLDLRPSLDELFRAAHKTSVQQAIRRAEREPLSYHDGRSEDQLNDFYRLLVLTRRRHMLPPQPIEWFRNLVACMGDDLKIRVASKDGRTVASILTLHWGNTILYKYGCSDATFHNLGGIAFLLWKTIQEGKDRGAQSLDFGRSDLDNPGLITFKDRWGATQSSLEYLRYSSRPSQRGGDSSRAKFVRRLFARMPDEMLKAAGRLLYRHIG